MQLKRPMAPGAILGARVRIKMLRILMSDKATLQFLKDRDRLSMDREVLKYISQRTCTAARQEQCIVERPKDPKDWCARCLALDHLVNT